MEKAGRSLDQGLPLPRDGRWLTAKPGAALLALVGVVFAADYVGAWTSTQLMPGLGLFEPLVDAAIDLVLVMPLLLILFVLPARRHIRARDASEHALRAAGEELELRVDERTIELRESNARLRQEAEDRRRAQLAVEFQASLLDAVAEAVVAIDSEGRVLFWNRFAESLFGWGASEAVGEGFAGLVRFVTPEGQCLDVLEQCGEFGAWAGEVEAVGRDGARAALLLTCSRMPGEARGYVCVALDIAEWKVAGDALRDSEEKYSSLVDNCKRSTVPR